MYLSIGEALIACNVKSENFMSIGLSENAHGENPLKKKNMFTKWAQVPNEKNVIFARGAELLQFPMVGNDVDTHSGLVPQ